MTKYDAVCYELPIESAWNFESGGVKGAKWCRRFSSRLSFFKNRLKSGGGYRWISLELELSRKSTVSLRSEGRHVGTNVHCEKGVNLPAEW